MITWAEVNPVVLAYISAYSQSLTSTSHVCSDHDCFAKIQLKTLPTFGIQLLP